MTTENIDKGQTLTEADSQGHCALGDGSALLTETAFRNSIRAATYSHGSHLPADAWKGVACDMRDWARKCEANAREYEQRCKDLTAALVRLDALYRAEMDEPPMRPEWLSSLLPNHAICPPATHEPS